MIEPKPKCQACGGAVQTWTNMNDTEAPYRAGCPNIHCRLHDETCDGKTEVEALERFTKQ